MIKLGKTLKEHPNGLLIAWLEPASIKNQYAQIKANYFPFP